MNRNLVFKTLVFGLSTMLLVSCGRNGKDYKNSSRATGWSINDRDGGFQANTDYKEQEAAPGLIFIEGGTFTMGRVQDDVMHDWNNTPTQQHVQSFYMDETEVTNLMYLEYLDYLKRVFPPEEANYRNIYYGALPDTLVWRNRLGFNETMTENYLRHPAYARYPVVGVSWIQAVEFSTWRTNRYNEYVLEQEGFTQKGAKYNVDAQSTFDTDTYLQAPSLTYGGQDDVIRGGKASERREKNNTPRPNPNNPGSTGEAKDIYVQMKDGIISTTKYRLPTEAEWEYAALGLVGLREYNVYRGRKKYPWDGAYTRSGNRRNRGDQLANFKQGDGDYGGIAGWSDDNADITAPIKSYEPNDYGLYDMAGNVSEWVADVYRPIVDDEYNDFNYYRGNVYTKNAITEDGTVKVLTTEDIVYDTLENGKIVARGLPGEIAQVPVDDEETYLRTQFSESDNRNFRDGDKQSSRYYQSFSDADSDSDRMYDSPINRIREGEEGMIKEYDKENDRTTLVDDEVRVYKGGSWRDREYWLDPAQRRYLPQTMATDDIGFRNAMSRVGSKSTKNKTPRN
ncbi:MULTISPECIES: gliding motility lipoprotein GldJ [Leeuwenhoekiella]|jgi:gliding motility-associated lipoprotein GldJ|uniref:Lipoprotein, putative n=2 Tax=Leeuwenhoekiella TaxID=283735 RepID=A3XQP4_LEEBM|nr:MULTISPECIES: gliding motility lipoprotein GldJ [Leeuwenhoekiella]EAQ48081.1 lipoprotein, putative [Leeuwenhoekiella blandensis MED217]MAO43752.1 gliding motility lipoprotein GldJ [Leeuwenhoekiella sp.]MBQ52443.1 gliding motility lipoprotein GldJ [Leeuwenhoekiella sp.]HBT08832.1 gliding motility lipoprotein GldJ [Leeuwenhoekiella sp.]HCW63522.1 gliding motility lipoprotein GldJ [Leeuwenhoekiella sp.]|tara:strand:- start:941 stop:2638 length:1698 start_codon:yes stop_codon:yes gene_type:complete